MILHAVQGMRGTVIDLDTGKKVRKVIWVDTDRGELEAYEVDENGQYVTEDDPYGRLQRLKYRARGRFLFLPAPAEKSPLGGRKLAFGAPRCLRCPSLLTLPGDDLCPACRARDRNQRHSMRVTRLDPRDCLIDRPCQAYGCGRVAVYAVGDEVDVTPQVQRGILYYRGVTVDRRYFCQRHYKPPRLLDAKGEVIESLTAPQP